MRTPLAPFFAAEVPDVATAGSALRFIYAAVFLAQVGLAVLVGGVLVTLAPSGARPHELVSVVLLTMAALHLPLGIVLAWAVSRRPGKGSALVGALTGAIVLSVPAWFAVLLAITGHRTPYLAAGWALVALGYAGGMALSPRWVSGATRPPEPDVPRTPEPDVPPQGVGTSREGGFDPAAAAAAEPLVERASAPVPDPLDGGRP